MVTKKKTTKKRAAPRAAAPKRRTYRKKSDSAAIPGAAATAALVAVNYPNIVGLVHAINNNGAAKPAEMIKRAIPGNSGWVTERYGKFVSKDALITDAAAVAGGYIAGEVIKKYAPGIIKRPIAKISKKIPKVF